MGKVANAQLGRQALEWDVERTSQTFEVVLVGRRLAVEDRCRVDLRPVNYYVSTERDAFGSAEVESSPIDLCCQGLVAGILIRRDSSERVGRTESTNVKPDAALAFKRSWAGTSALIGRILSNELTLQAAGIVL